ncbi:rCG48860 [Rattus norvegicus]|uniref:RCG48860 n=1 Tax=Rattus norvegicus TaxID=10116 RepID=A6IGE8_RAT|nr:rCG48860 [Rattus norvegicus]
MQNQHMRRRMEMLLHAAPCVGPLI